MAKRASFIEQLETQWKKGKFVCIGLDPDLEKLPKHFKKNTKSYEKFLLEIIDATADIALAYKPNLAFYEWDHGAEVILQKVVDYIHQKYPQVPVIADAKRGDIENTNSGYARALWERYEFDATTVHCYLGPGTYPPFLLTPGKGIIAMCKTSNPDAAFYQDLVVDLTTSLKDGAITKKEFDDLKKATKNTKVPLYFLVAYRHKKLNKENPNVGIVVGATHPETFEMIRKLYGDGPILIPGIGAQGGSLEDTLKFAPNSKKQGMIINAGRSIIFASAGKYFAKAARVEAEKLDQQIKNILNDR